MNFIKTLLIDFYNKFIKKRKLKYNINNYIDPIFKLLNSGCRWKDIDTDFIKNTTVFKFFKRLIKYDAFGFIHKILVKS